MLLKQLFLKKVLLPEVRNSSLKHLQMNLFPSNFFIIDGLLYLLLAYLLFGSLRPYLPNSNISIRMQPARYLSFHPRGFHLANAY